VKRKIYYALVNADAELRRCFENSPLPALCNAGHDLVISGE